MYLHEYREDSSPFPKMNVNEAISIGILVVNDDVACQNKVAQVLRSCNYEVLHTGTVYDALHSIWENKDRLDLVITNLQKLRSEGLAVIQNIKQRLKLNVLLIRSDGRIESKGELLSFSAYALNGLSVNSFNNLLENAKRVNGDGNQQENVERESISSAAAIDTNKASSSMKDETRLNLKRKASDFYGERSEDSNDDDQKGKKPRVTWTNEMHQKFLDAIERLGYEKAVPKKIVEVMGVPGLTRENVASHLQKYRCSMKRTQETIFSSLPCRSTRNGLQGLSVLTSPSNMPSFPQSSFLHTVKESKLQYSSKSADLAFSSRSEGQFYSRIGGNLSGVRNMMQQRDKHISTSDQSDTTKFVGYRFIGNQIDYGPIKTNADKMLSTSERLNPQSTSYVQNHPIPDQRTGTESSLLGSSSSRFHGTETAGVTINTSQEPDFLSSCSSKIEDLIQDPPTLNNVQQPGDQNGSLLDQNASIPTLDQDLSEQHMAAFLDDILRCSPPPPPLPPHMFQDLDETFENDDDSFLTGIGDTYDPFDVQGFDDTFFSQDI